MLRFPFGPTASLLLFLEITASSGTRSRDFDSTTRGNSATYSRTRSSAHLILPTRRPDVSRVRAKRPTPSLSSTKTLTPHCKLSRLKNVSSNGHGAVDSESSANKFLISCSANSARVNIIGLVPASLLQKVPGTEPRHVMSPPRPQHLHPPRRPRQRPKPAETYEQSPGRGWCMSWPLLNRGTSYYGAKETNNFVFFMGNPLLSWAASAAVGGLYV